MAQHKTADASKLAVDAEPLTMKVGVEPHALPAPRPDLNGLRILNPESGNVFLILDGQKSWTPNPATYNNLFRDWTGIITDIQAGEIPTGPTLSDGAVLAVASGGGVVYLVSNGLKRQVANPQVMYQYHFAWNRIVSVPAVLLDSIPSGQPILPR